MIRNAIATPATPVYPVTAATLVRTLRLERLCSPYSGALEYQSEETLKAALGVQIHRLAERRMEAPEITRSDLTGHVLGAIYYSPYWHEHYTVKSIDERGFVTVRWHGRGEGNFIHRLETTHCTSAARDQLVGSTGWWQ